MRVFSSPVGELVAFPPALRWRHPVSAVPPPERILGVSDRCDRSCGADPVDGVDGMPPGSQERSVGGTRTSVDSHVAVDQNLAALLGGFLDELDHLVEPPVGHLLAGVVDSEVEVADVRGEGFDEVFVGPLHSGVEDVSDAEAVPGLQRLNRFVERFGEVPARPECFGQSIDVGSGVDRRGLWMGCWTFKVVFHVIIVELISSAPTGVQPTLLVCHYGRRCPADRCGPDQGGDGVAVVLTVTNPRSPGLKLALEPEMTMDFGRAIGGVGRISDHREVSRHHGTLVASDDGFAVISTGTHAGFVVADRTTPLRLYVPCGVGPVSVPFADASLIVEFGEEFDYLDIMVTGSDAADRWSNAWGPEMRERSADAAREKWAALLTAPPMSEVRWRMANGKPYAWFDTLIAMCEPTLGVGPAGTPTNRQLATRRRVKLRVIERHVASIYEALGFDTDDKGARYVIVQIAVDQGLVTRADLTALG